MTNRCLSRCRDLLTVAKQLSSQGAETQEQFWIAAWLPLLNQALCAWVAEMMEASAIQSQKWVLQTHIIDLLDQLPQNTAPEIEELRQLRNRPGSFLNGMHQAQMDSVQTVSAMPPQVGNILSRQITFRLADCEQWLADLTELINRGRSTLMEY
ncbi:MAG: DUF6586 family protein [Gammaproteobacteria bacterium]